MFIRVLAGLHRQLAREGQTALSFDLSPLAEGQQSQAERHDQASSQGQDDASPPPFASGGGRIPEGQASIQEVTFHLVQLAGVGRRPLPSRRQPGSLVQIALVPVVPRPLQGSLAQPLVETQRLPVLRQPTLQGWPAPDQGLVGYLHGLLACLRVARGGDQAHVGQPGHHLPDIRLFFGGSDQLGEGGPPPGVGGAFAETGQTQHHPAYVRLLIWRELAQQTLGPLGERPLHTANSKISGKG